MSLITAESGFFFEEDKQNIHIMRELDYKNKIDQKCGGCTERVTGLVQFVFFTGNCVSLELGDLFLSLCLKTPHKSSNVTLL